ncbi:MAG: PIN domain-containing protein [Chloroflexi bacterium]|nr:PIN domain-containing protein [Chloroflexota bacterium]
MVGHILAISFVTVGELFRWPVERNWGARRIEELEERMRETVWLPWQESVAREWARLMANNPNLGQNDAWVAACAKAYDCTLITDDKSFLSINGLTVIVH